MIYLLIGRREQGKTTLARYMALRQPASLTFDPRRMIGKDAHRAETAEELQADFAGWSDGSIDDVIFTPPGNVQAGFLLFSSALAHAVRNAPKRRFAVHVDEVGFLNLETDDFMWVLRCCDRSKVQIILTAHRPIDIPTTIRAIADHWVIFPCRQEHDLRVIEQRCSPATAIHAAKLAPRCYVHWDDARADLEVNRNPDGWYTPLQAGRDTTAALDVEGSGLTGEDPFSVDRGRLF